MATNWVFKATESHFPTALGTDVSDQLSGGLPAFGGWVHAMLLSSTWYLESAVSRGSGMHHPVSAPISSATSSFS